MTRKLQTAVGLTLLALTPVRAAAQVADSLDEVVRAGRFTFTPFTQGEPVMRAERLPRGDADCAADAIGRHPKARVSEPSSKEPATTAACRTGNTAHTNFRKRDRPRVAAWESARATALRQAAHQQAPAAGTRALRSSLQGGLLALGGDGWLNAGGLFGAGVAATPFPNLALYGDGHLVAGMEGGGAAFYGSGTVALRGMIPSTSAEKVACIAGVGLGLFAGGDYVAAGPQLVFGLEGEAGFGQIRVLRLPAGIGSFVLLGGFRF